MGLFNKLFSYSKTNNKHQPVSINFLEEHIRVLLFRECEFKGRKVLFDTNKKTSNNNGNHVTSKEPSNHLPHNQLAEMVFGSVAMGFNSCCFKIHLIQSKSQLMFTQVFPGPRHREKVRESFSSSSSQCLEQNSAVFDDSATSSTNSSASDQLSNYSCTSEIFGDSLSSLSSGNVYKKWLRSNNCLNSGSFGSSKDGASTSSHHRSSKLGFVLIINIPQDNEHYFLDFCMDHISLLESLMHRSRRLIEVAYTKPHTFELSMEEVSKISIKGIYNLVLSQNLTEKSLLYCDIRSVAFNSAPRNSFFTKLLRRNTLNKSGSGTSPYGNFINEFCELLHHTDNKNTSFFISGLITAVLSHHLGWVTSSMELDLEGGNSAIWNQLMNLYGAIGNPSKMSHTIVMGDSQEIVDRVLRCLAYFIKCCDIKINEVCRDNVEEENRFADEMYEKMKKKVEAVDVHRSLDKINNNYLKIGVFFKTKNSGSETFQFNNVTLQKTKSFTSNLFKDNDSDANDVVIKNNDIVNEISDDVVFTLGENEENVHSKSAADVSTNSESPKKSCSTNMRIIKMPMPRSTKKCKELRKNSDILSVFKGIIPEYMPDMVLQGTTSPKQDFIYKLKNDLALTSQQTQFGKYVEEVVAILANTQSWEVHLMSSHTYVIDPNATGLRVYMSQLISNMLESLFVMWKLQVPHENCISHLENKLQEICIRSKTLAQLLLKAPICSLELLNSTLHLDVNDVPLLMAIASIHTPQVTQKYGLSFQ
ncbi:unnamed protein product [Brassicogethes aeneus]|uniref:Folliculin-interacting protein 1 n=1 Tax=Brassicogethes aeneus TaxID=1431903 RepID=A0A9P0B7C2_BRAAE|nr:unnamed protein product [Brassicogethes aeneus]